MTKSWNTNALLVPMAFTAGGFSGKGLITKAAYTGAALIGGKLQTTYCQPAITSHTAIG